MMIVLGHEPMDIEPIKPLNAIKIMQAIAPYSEQMLDVIVSNEEFLTKLFSFLLKLTENPQLALQVYSLIVNVDFQWLIDNAETEELVVSFPVLNAVNQGILQFFYEMIYFMAMLNVKPNKD